MTLIASCNLGGPLEALFLRVYIHGIEQWYGLCFFTFIHLKFPVALLILTVEKMWSFPDTFYTLAHSYDEYMSLTLDKRNFQSISK